MRMSRKRVETSEDESEAADARRPRQRARVDAGRGVWTGQSGDGLREELKSQFEGLRAELAGARLELAGLRAELASMRPRLEGLERVVACNTDETVDIKETLDNFTAEFCSLRGHLEKA